MLTFEELKKLAPALNLSWISVNMLGKERMYLAQILNGRIKCTDNILEKIEKKLFTIKRESI